jgi:Thioredoxin like C-terminal domain
LALSATVPPASSRRSSKAAAGSVAYGFHTQAFNLVWSLRRRASGVRGFTVRLDRQPPRGGHGQHVDEPGEGTVSEPTMHQLAHRHGAIAQRTFEITFLDPGGRDYVVT